MQGSGFGTRICGFGVMASGLGFKLRGNDILSDERVNQGETTIVEKRDYNKQSSSSDPTDQLKPSRWFKQLPA